MIRGEVFLMEVMKRVGAVLLAWGLVGGLVVLVLSTIAGMDAERGRLIRAVYEPEWSLDAPANALYQSGDYAALVDVLEDQFDHYDACVADLGGMDNFIRTTGRYRRAMGIGFSQLYGRLDGYVDYNARFTPPFVEYFLMMVWRDTEPVTPELSAFAGELCRSERPMLQAYGHWFLMQAEVRERKLWRWENVDRQASYPRIEAYRTFVYEQSLMGEAWAHGFAADASRFDPDLARAVGFMHRYHELVRDQWLYWHAYHTIRWRVAEYVQRPTAEIEALGDDQRAFIHRVLDRELVPTDSNCSEDMVRLYELMGRASDVLLYRQNKQAQAVVSQILHRKRPIHELGEEDLRGVHGMLDTSLRMKSMGNHTRESLRRAFAMMGREREFDAAF